MRIALLANANSIHTVRWANALAEREMMVHLFSAHEFSETLSDNVLRHKLPIAANLGYFANAPYLRMWLARIRPDILHSHYASGYGTLGRLSGYRPHVLSVWGSDVFDFPMKSRAKRWLLVKNLRSADQVCSTSHAMARHTASLCTTARPIAVTPFGIDLNHFRSFGGRTNGSSIVVGAVKALCYQYGIDTLIKGFAQCRDCLAQESPDLSSRLRLRIVGEGPQEGELRALAEARGVADVTEFVGHVRHEDVPRELNKLDVYVAMSRSESFGVAIIEASACERPVIVSDAPGLQEVVEDGETGIVVAREMVNGLADALRNLVARPERRIALGAAGRKRVQRLYDWRNNVAEMQRIYNVTIGQVKAT